MAISICGAGETFGYAVCGFGPAGCGFLLHAYKNHVLDELARDGLLIIDRERAPGSGKVGHYKLTGNSLSSVFMDCIDDPGFVPLFEELKASHPAVQAMRQLKDEVPPLDLVGSFLEAMADRFKEYLVEAHGARFLLQTEIDRITRTGSGLYDLRLRDLAGGRDLNLVVRNVISAFGGRQPLELVAECPILPGITLNRWHDKLIMSDDFLMMPDEVIQARISIASGASDEVTILGGSHSCFSAIDRLTDALAVKGLRKINVLHRGPIRLFYPSAEAAIADGYSFVNPDDICPMSGRVNRFGGLRYRSFDVAKAVLTTGRVPDGRVAVDLIRLIPGDAALEARVVDLLDQAPAVVTGLGYQANIPLVMDASDQEIKLDNSLTGQAVDDGGQVLTARGEVLHGLYAFGLGADLLKTSEAIGGEPSFKGRADGVWLYQNHGGEVILQSILKDRMAIVPPKRVAFG